MKFYTMRQSLLLSVALTVVSYPISAYAQKAHPPHWAYAGSEGPSTWGKLDKSFATCSLGHAQSPINITHAQPAELPPLKFDYKPVPLDIIDNGHTVQINYAPGSTLTVGDKTYTLKQFHFHHPSEEHINGHGFDLVSHLVHADADGHLAVVAILFKPGAENPLLATLWKSIPSEKEKAVDVPGVLIDVSTLLPDDHGYYTFTGSLTTPPCSEGVTWYVLKSQSSISSAEVAVFAKLYPKDARPIQPLNGRQVLETK